jgi:hypothetical protein
MKSKLASEEALRAARLDAEKAYRDLTAFFVQVELERVAGERAERSDGDCAVALVVRFTNNVVVTLFPLSGSGSC